MNKINLVCIVDDDPTHVFITKKYLEKTGKVDSIIVCTDGKMAFEKLKAIIGIGGTLPDIILLDLNMPVWDGWHFLDEFVKVPISKKITIYILTSSVSEVDKKRAETYNLNGNYIIKPLNMTALNELLDRELA